MPRGNDDPPPDDLAELARRRCALRRSVLAGHAALPPEAAARLIGPDCAYHLYRHLRPRPPDAPEEPS